MSDVVVIETVPAEIVEVVAVGPQGPVGDVNPQMPVILAATEAARDAALVSELAAAASQSAAATSAANAATSESNAATSAATATAQATASAGSATASAGSAAAAQASATNAATSETNAANSATASANSATSSANSATAAQAARTATESARDTTLATVGTMVLKANNLSDLASIPTALVNLGLNNVSNTSDANKPVSTAMQAALDLKENAANKGAANGYAGLDAAGKVPANQLPSYVDDVLEFANLAAFPATGEAGKIYVALDTNKTYRWSGSTYIYITSGAVDSVAGKTGIVVLAKADVGLGSVDNTSDADKPVSAAAQAALNLKADAASPTTTGTLTHSGDIVLSGSGKRITGDFSNATIANRVMFQTSTANSSTQVRVIPNGTSTTAGFAAANNSDPTNSAVIAITATASDAQLNSFANGTGTYLPMTFYTSGSERMRIDTSGNVGIGTSAPGFPLTVSSSTTLAGGQPSVMLQGQSNTERIAIRSSGAGGGTAVMLVSGSNGTTASPSATTNNQGLGYYQFGGYTGSAWNRVAWISGIAAEDWTPTATGSYMVFSTTPTGSTTIAERMRIDSGGNVGIGTIAPGGKLHVQSGSVTNPAWASSDVVIAANAAGSPTYYQTLSDTAGGLVFSTPTTRARSYLLWSEGSGDCTLQNGSTSAIRFVNNGSERMRIDSSGNVLVTNPAGLGYGTGAGGTVTQATSKSTAVTLNKPTGQITMNNAALAAGASVQFQCNNSLVSTNDVVVISKVGPGGALLNYDISSYVATGAIYFGVKNVAGTSLSEAVVFNFAIIKGAVA